MNICTAQILLPLNRGYVVYKTEICRERELYLRDILSKLLGRETGGEGWRLPSEGHTQHPKTRVFSYRPLDVTLGEKYMVQGLQETEQLSTVRFTGSPGDWATLHKNIYLAIIIYLYILEEYGHIYPVKVLCLSCKAMTLFILVFILCPLSQHHKVLIR